MKKVKLLFAPMLLIARYNLFAQVAMSTDGTSADASAILGVKFDTSGNEY